MDGEMKGEVRRFFGIKSMDRKSQARDFLREFHQQKRQQKTREVQPGPSRKVVAASRESTAGVE